MRKMMFASAMAAMITPASLMMFRARLRCLGAAPRQWPFNPPLLAPSPGASRHPLPASRGEGPSTSRALLPVYGEKVAEGRMRGRNSLNQFPQERHVDRDDEYQSNPERKEAER